MPKNGEHFIFPFLDGTAKLCGTDHEMRSENLLQGRINLKGVKISEKNFKETRRGPSQQKRMMTLKPEMTSDQSKGTSFIVITQNLEFISTCRKKNRFTSTKVTLT